MIIYNALPFAYQDADQITSQIKSLSYMGFGIIWLNPMQNARRFLEYPGGNLYLMTNENLFVNHWHRGDCLPNEEALSRLKEEANKHNITLMFDLVMNQVGNRLEKVLKYRQLFENAILGKFDYSTATARIEIFNIFFKPFIERYVKQYGFTGMRIDAASEVHPHIQKMAIDYFRALCQEYYQKDGLILGDFPGDNTRLQPLKEMGIQYDAITNATSRIVNTSPYFNPKHRGSHNTDMGEKRALAKAQGTIGWTGNAKQKNLYASCLAELPMYTFRSIQENNKILAKMMREKIAVHAFISDGGYSLLCGDEFGSSQHRSCSEYEGPEGEPALKESENFSKNWGGKFDMTHYIAHINAIRNSMKRAVDLYFWSEQYVVSRELDPHHLLKCIVRNNGAGFSGPMDIVLINTDPLEHNFALDNPIISDIKQQIKNEHPEFDLHKNDIHIHLAGFFVVNNKLVHNHTLSQPDGSQAHIQADTYTQNVRSSF